jgi:oxygen-independent coproporphyrinogen-3 oxidase
MLNTLRLRDGFDLGLYTERTGLPLSSVAATLDVAEARGLIRRNGAQLAPTERGFDFLSDLQELFL